MFDLVVFAVGTFDLVAVVFDTVIAEVRGLAGARVRLRADMFQDAAALGLETSSGLIKHDNTNIIQFRIRATTTRER